MQVKRYRSRDREMSQFSHILPHHPLATGRSRGLTKVAELTSLLLSALPPPASSILSLAVSNLTIASMEIISSLYLNAKYHSQTGHWTKDKTCEDETLYGGSF